MCLLNRFLELPPSSCSQIDFRLFVCLFCIRSEHPGGFRELKCGIFLRDVEDLIHEWTKSNEDSGYILLQFS